MKETQGFTLIELVITVTVLAVVVTLAAPSFNSVLQGNRATASANQLVTAIQIARSEALKRAGSVSLCASDDQATCSDDWNKGWIILDDGSGDVIQSWADPVRGGEVTLDGTVDDDTIRFWPAGNSDLANSITFQLRFQGCSGDGNRDISLTPSGRVGVSREAC